MNSRVECGGCRFWQRNREHPDRKAEHRRESDWGRCHVNPPTVGSDQVGVWPQTQAGDWCGRGEASS